MRALLLLSFALSLSAVACGETIDARGEYGSSSDPVTRGQVATRGIPCSYLRGEASLSDYAAGDYAAASYSFRYASQDPAVTRNDVDVLYERDFFQVNMVTDDRSSIVDLGVVALRDVPSRVDPREYPVGKWGEHDDIDAQIDHTYFVQSVDGSGRHVVAFQVMRLEPGRRVSLTWVRSIDPDVMVFPSWCF